MAARIARTRLRTCAGARPEIAPREPLELARRDRHRGVQIGERRIEPAAEPARHRLDQRDMIGSQGKARCCDLCGHLRAHLPRRHPARSASGGGGGGGDKGGILRPGQDRIGGEQPVVHLVSRQIGERLPPKRGERGADQQRRPAEHARCGTQLRRVDRQCLWAFRHAGVFDLQRAAHDHDHLRRIGRHDFRNLCLAVPRASR
jgi:hypothetical protein